MAIEVRSRNGGRCSAIDSFLRNLFRPIDAFGFYLVGFLVAAFSALNQRIGDRVAKTVVKEKPSARRGRAVIGWILLNILLGFAAFSATKLVQKAGTTVWPIEFEQAKSLADSFMSDLVANRLEDASRKMFVDMGHDKTAEAIDSAFRICGHPTDGKFDHTQLGEFTTENGSKTPMRKLYYFTPTTENPEGRCSFFFEVIADRNGKYKIASLGVSKAIL
jgi:hypothetical protein